MHFSWVIQQRPSLLYAAVKYRGISRNWKQYDTHVRYYCASRFNLNRTGTISKCAVLVQTRNYNYTPTDQGKALIVDKDAGDILVASFNRPNVRNAINFEMLTKFDELIDHIISHLEQIKVIILRSLTPGIFCAGADLKERISQSEIEYRKWSYTVRKMTKRFSDLPVPSIAAIDGPALGGGLELALMCDLRIAGTNAKLGLPETSLAIIPGAGGTQRLPRLIGSSKAKEMIFTAKILTADQALNYGLVNQVVSQNEIGDAAFQRSLSLSKCIIQAEKRLQRHSSKLLIG